MTKRSVSSSRPSSSSSSSSTTPAASHAEDAAGVARLPAVEAEPVLGAVGVALHRAAVVPEDIH